MSNDGTLVSVHGASCSVHAQSRAGGGACHGFFTHCQLARSAVWNDRNGDLTPVRNRKTAVLVMPSRFVFPFDKWFARLGFDHRLPARVACDPDGWSHIRLACAELVANGESGTLSTGKRFLGRNPLSDSSVSGRSPSDRLRSAVAVRSSLRPGERPREAGFAKG
jgi:hypothetical protein